MRPARVKRDNAFAVMALPAIWTGGQPAAIAALQFDDTLAALPALRLPLSRPLRRQIGTRASADIAGADLYLVATCRCGIDAEREPLRRLAHWAYFSLLLSVGFVRHGRAYMLDGYATPTRLRDIGIAEYDPALIPKGSPPARIRPSELRRAFRRTRAVQQLFTGGLHPRFGRVMAAFLHAVGMHALDRRLHQAVRCVEGFVHPGQSGLKKRFAERCQLFLGRGDAMKAFLEELWDLRSVVEHLHGPFRIITEPGERERRLVLLRRTIEAESLARYCIETFLDTPGLWPHFANEAAVEAFWALPQTKQRAIWGPRLDLAQLDLHFDPAAITNADLMLES
jgi:hypothetical protein